MFEGCFIRVRGRVGRQRGGREGGNFRPGRGGKILAREGVEGGIVFGGKRKVCRAKRGEKN